MKMVALCAVVGAGVVVCLNGSVSDPSSWAVVLASVTGGGLLAGRSKPPIGIDDDMEA
jgi:hypothetical protein